MSNLVNQHQQASFSTPVNGTVNDASVVLSNDNATVTSYNSHDADFTIHVQQSTVAARPAFGTAGRLWLTNDDFVLAYDTGLAWQTLKVPASSITAGTFGSGNYTFPANLTVTGILSGSSTLTIAGAATFNGDVTFGNATTDTVAFTSRLASGVTWASDNTNDIGASGANRPRDLFVGRDTLIGGTLGVTGAVTFTGSLGVGTVTAGTLSSSSGLTVGGGAVSLGSGAVTAPGDVTLANGLGSELVLGSAATSIGMYGASPTGQQTVTGSRGGNAALADLLTALATLGAIVDGSSA